MSFEKGGFYETAVQVALCKGHERVAQTLVANGAKVGNHGLFLNAFAFEVRCSYIVGTMHESEVVASLTNKSQDNGWGLFLIPEKLWNGSKNRSAGT